MFTNKNGLPLCHWGRRVVWPQVNGTVGDWHLAVPEWTPKRELLRSVTFVPLSPEEKALLQYLYPMHWGLLARLKTTRRTVVECAVLCYDPAQGPDRDFEWPVHGVAGDTSSQVGV